MAAYKTTWRSVNLLFHGSASLDDQSISIFGMKMSMNRNIMMKDPQVQGMARFISAISLMAHDSVYIYTCAVGIADGLKELCIHLDEVCGLTNGIFLSTDNTGNPPSGNWRIEWGTKRGFLVDGLHDNEIEHAQNDLFSDLSGLSFELSSTQNQDGFQIGATVTTSGYKVGQIISYKNGSLWKFYLVCKITNNNGTIKSLTSASINTDTLLCIPMIPGHIYTNDTTKKFFITPVTISSNVTNTPNQTAYVIYPSNINLQGNTVNCMTTNQDKTQYIFYKTAFVNPAVFYNSYDNVAQFYTNSTLTYKPVETQIWPKSLTINDNYCFGKNFNDNKQRHGWAMDDLDNSFRKVGTTTTMRFDIRQTGIPEQNNFSTHSLSTATSFYTYEPVNTDTFNGPMTDVDDANKPSNIATKCTGYIPILSNAAYKVTLIGEASPIFMQSNFNKTTNSWIEVLKASPLA
jgi:hypothetical protein